MMGLESRRGLNYVHEWGILLHMGRCGNRGGYSGWQLCVDTQPNPHWSELYHHKSPVESVVIMVNRLYYRLWWWSQILGHDFEEWS